MKSLKYFLSLGIAAGAGLAIGVLTAPRKGKHTRNRISNEINNAKDTLEEAANEKLAEAKSIIDKTIKEQKNKGAATIAKLKEAATS